MAQRRRKTKTCNVCNEEKIASAFYRRSISDDGLAFTCKACANAASAKWNHDNPDIRFKVRRNSHLKRKFGITLDQYQELLDKQNGCCAICGRSAEEFPRELAVDHDHVTRRIRGLLCTGCNYRLVARHRNGEILRKIADYVEQGTDWYVPAPKRRRKTTRKAKPSG